jgi:two-component system cell cycle response regulator
MVPDRARNPRLVAPPIREKRQLIMDSDNRPQPLKVLVVTKNRAVQRRLSQFLGIVQYHVLQAADAHSALVAVDAQSPDVALLGWDVAAASEWELCHVLSQRPSAAGMFKILMIKDPDETQMHEALEAGIDDVLPEPVGCGELLARLRAAARVLEYDRRAREQEPLDAVTGLPGQFSFTRRLHTLATPTSGTAPRLACVVIDIDFFGRINRSQGMAAGETLLRAVAQQLTRLATGDAVVGYLGGDRFGVILSGSSDLAAAEWAELARAELAAAKFKLGETVWQITASFGIASGDVALAPDIIDRATQALQTAKSSGRDCVARWGEFDSNADDLAPNRLFERATARDVMTPCTVFLRADEPAGHAVELLHRTRLEGIPVIDGDGKLVGLCEQHALAALPEVHYESHRIREVMTTDVATFDEQESFASLMEFFTRDSRSLTIVVHKSRPVGFVTCNGLLALPQPLTTATLAGNVCYRDSSDYLLVPDVSPLAADRLA